MPHHNPGVMRAALARVVLIALVGVLAAPAGVSDLLDLVSTDTDCDDPCPGDGDGGRCSSDCTDCTCCPRAVPGLPVVPAADGPPRQVDEAPSPASRPVPPEIANAIFHPPRG